MQLGICTIQRNRAKWLKEWVIFHHLVGISIFYIYLHKCTDNSKEVLEGLQKIFKIHIFEVNNETFRPQIVAYQHAYREFGHNIDWMAFIDGDEFLFPSTANTLIEVLKEYQYEKLSALAVYWQCFGSSKHIKDPNGLLIEDYQFRAKLDFIGNRHIKSIVKGGQGSYCTTTENSHLFNTIYGTYDELLRPIDRGLMDTLFPSYEKIRINHYATQSLEFFKNFKQASGAADAGSSMIRDDSWWDTYDKNEELDNNILRFIKPINIYLSLIE